METTVTTNVTTEQYTYYSEISVANSNLNDIAEKNANMVSLAMISVVLLGIIVGLLAVQVWRGK